ncbi:MAG: hypothetical protein ABJG42_24055 [Vibrio splendidus]
MIINPIFMCDSALAFKANYSEDKDRVRITFRVRSKQPAMMIGIAKLVRDIAGTITPEMITEMDQLFGDKALAIIDKWKALVQTNDGSLPLRITAIDECSVVHDGDTVLTIESTEDGYAWLPSYISAIVSPYLEAALNYGSAVLRTRMALRVFGDTSNAKDVEMTKAFMGSNLYSPNLESAGARGALFRVAFPLEPSPIGTKYIAENYGGAPQIFPVIQVHASERLSSTMSAHLNKMLGVASDRLLVYSFEEKDCDELLKLISGELKDRISHRSYPILFDYVGDDIDRLLNILDTLEKTHTVTTNSLGYKVLPRNIYVGMRHPSIQQLESDISKLTDLKWSIESLVFWFNDEALISDDIKVAANTQIDPTTESKLSVYFENGTFSDNSTYQQMSERFERYMSAYHLQSKDDTYGTYPDSNMTSWVYKLVSSTHWGELDDK